MRADRFDRVGYLTVVDREQGGRERIEEAGYGLVSLFTAAELLEHAPEAH